MAADPLIIRATEDDIHAFAQRRWPDAPSQRLYAYLALNAPGDAWIARDVETAIGIGFSHAGSDETFISELYVEPSYRNQGIGSALFERLLDGGEARSQAVLIDPREISATAFCLRRGIPLTSTVLRVCGTIPREEELAALAYGAYRFRTMPLDVYAHGYALDALDREVRGSARAEDHRMFAGVAHGSAVFLEDELVGYVYVWPDGRVGPIATASPSYSAQCFAFGLVSLQRDFGASWCSAGIPGENLRVLRAALQVGLKIDIMRLFGSNVPSSDLSRYVGYHPLLF